jgi:hypothetical protein
VERVTGMTAVEVNETENLVGVGIEEKVRYHCSGEVRLRSALMQTGDMQEYAHTNIADDQIWPCIHGQYLRE